MNLDPEILKKLIETFKPELEEKLQDITDHALILERAGLDEPTRKNAIEIIFRAAHNIKGTSRGIGINDVGTLAHHLESLFTNIQKNTITLSPAIISLTLDAVDKLRQAMQAFISKKPLDFNLEEFIHHLNTGQPLTKEQKHEEIPIISTKEMTPESIDSDSIRVSIKNLDHISALMEEFQLNKIAIDDHYNALAHLSTKMASFEQQLKQVMHYTDPNASTSKALAGINHVFSDLVHETLHLQQTMHKRINEINVLSNTLLDEVRTLRLIPAAVLLRTLPRTVRDIAQSLQKSVEFSIHGDSVKMDKMVLEGLKDPLIHILRNAVDHGIEESTVRKAANKPEVAHIAMHVIDQGDHIDIQITDDGAGIDSKKIADTACQKNLLTPEELLTLSNDDILNLVFKPGFSTKKIITDVSGRGFGLDIVKENITRLKGHVSIATELGKGTMISLSVPLTLASERGFLITCAGQTFVIPSTLIEHVVTLPKKNILHIEGTEAIDIDQHPIPLRLLSSLLNISQQIPNKELYTVLIAKKDQDHIGFIVDEILGEREIVIKPTLAPLDNMTLVSGGTLSSEGKVILVLNVNALINQALTRTQHISIEEAPETLIAPHRPHILIVDDSITTRTLEKNILESKEYKVTAAVNGKEAWDLLQKESFSLVITDVSMPIMDGFTLTEHIKTNDKLRELPVIIVTSLDSEAEKKRGIDVGADAYIIKNAFESNELLSIVAQLL
jgi:two-component system, chemotaxis family, sensor kinase CheA